MLATDRLKLAIDEKSTVRGKEFRTFTILFQQRSFYELCYHILILIYVICR